MAAYFGQPYFDILVAVCALILAWEWGQLCATRPAAIVTLGVSLLAAVLAVALTGPFLALGVLAVGFVAVAMVAGVARAPALTTTEADHVPRRHIWLAVGTLYMGIPLIALIWLRANPDLGRDTVFWLFAVVWASDTGAYVFGRLIGGPRMAPTISPKKTWAGLLGGVACAGAASAATIAALGRNDLVLFGALGAIMGAVAQGGDLFESWVKRRFQVKDASNIIPGHGGLLDRVDGLMAAAVAWAVIDLAARNGILT
jgi:phosphatidate cytidylyltransferase